MRQFVAGLIFMALAFPAVAGEPQARGVVDKLNAGLLHVMRNADELGFDGRVEALATTLGDAYHLSVMAKAAVGRQWRGLDQVQRDRLVDAFTKMTLATYAERFNGFSGERFEVLGEEPAIKDLMLVRSELVKSDGNTVALNYLTKSYDGEWRIVDVYLEAKYSELARLRSEFTAVLGQGGFEALIAKIDERTKRASAAGG